MKLSILTELHDSCCACSLHAAEATSMLAGAAQSRSAGKRADVFRHGPRLWPHPRCSAPLHTIHTSHPLREWTSIVKGTSHVEHQLAHLRKPPSKPLTPV